MTQQPRPLDVWLHTLKTVRGKYERVLNRKNVHYRKRRNGGEKTGSEKTWSSGIFTRREVALEKPKRER